MKRNSILFAIIIGFSLTGASLQAMPRSTQEMKNNETRQHKKSGTPEKLQRQARLTLEQARETALKRAPGKVEDGELEREHGRLVYSFDIRNSKGTITEVQVNAIDGQVVSVHNENKKQEAAEKRKDSKKKS